MTKCSVDHSHHFQVILIPFQVYAASCILIRDLVLTHEQGIIYTHIGIWLCELCIDGGKHSCSLITEVAINSLAECTYFNFELLSCTCADEYVFIAHRACPIRGLAGFPRPSLTLS